MHELLTPHQSQLADELAMAGGRTFEQLVQNAGRAVATAAVQFSPVAVLIIAGPGHNGADGVVADELLTRHGLSTRLVQVDVDDADSIAEAVTVVDRFDSSGGRRLIVDALLGAGLNRDIDDGLAALVEAINQSSADVLAVDVPSGLDGATGQIRGVAVQASRTVTFFRKKPGHLLLPGRDLCGSVTVVDIGIPSQVIDEIGPRLWENHVDLWQLPERRSSDHKYDAGHCVVASGGRWSTGASRLAAWAALRIGAGAVTIAGPVDALDVHAAHVTAVMLAPAGGADELADVIRDRRAGVAVLGPALGVGEGTRRAVEAALATDAALVLDADALTSYGGMVDELAAHIARHASPVVLTPHAAEFERLFAHLDAPDKVSRARAAAASSGAVIVAKGADTVVASPDGRAVINANAPASLATAGSGDVLAGMIAGLLGQGMAPFDAAAAAVHEHGAAATRGPRRLTALDLIDALAHP